MLTVPTHGRGALGRDRLGLVLELDADDALPAAVQLDALLLFEGLESVDQDLQAAVEVDAVASTVELELGQHVPEELAGLGRDDRGVPVEVVHDLLRQGGRAHQLGHCLLPIYVGTLSADAFR